MTIEFSEHPEYIASKDNWLLYKLLYEGDQRALKGQTYLWPHELELPSGTALGHAPNSPYEQISPGQRVRMVREQRSTYTNEIEPIISRWQTIFFQEEPQADEQVLELFGDDINDVTGEGKSLNSFIKDDVLAARLLYGRPIIFTDAPDMKLATRADEVRAGFKPFFQVIYPLEFKDWEIETSAARKGQFKFARCEYYVVEPRSNSREKPLVALYSKELLFQPNSDGKTGTYSYNVFKLTKDSKTNKSQWILVSSNDFSGFPNLPIRSIENESSWIKDAAPLALKLYNLDSSCDNIHLYQAHQRVFIAGNLGNDEKRAMGEYNVSFLPEGAVVNAIEPVQTTSLENRIEKTLIRLRLVAYNQQRQIESSGAAVEGAATQREYKEALTSLVKSELETLENLVNLAIKDYAWFKNRKLDFQGKIRFSRDIDLDDIVQDIMFYQGLRGDIASYPTWKKATLKKFARAQNLEEVEAIVKEIDSTEILNPQQQAAQQGANRLQRIQEALNGGQSGNTTSSNGTTDQGA